MEEGEPIESLEVWLSKKPYWEQYVWKINLDKELLTGDDVTQCYQYLCDYLGLIEPLAVEKTLISFKNEIVSTPDASNIAAKIQILEIKDFENVNAISSDCSIKFGPNLTLVYGENGSGKSGIGRLLCNACFSRGEREILPNVKVALVPDAVAKATFIAGDSNGNKADINYILGNSNDILKRFSVFDNKSVLIHLDQSNKVKFTPGQIKIFDKVADTFSKLEERLSNEKNAKKKDNPFQSMFFDGATSSVAIFCKGINNVTKEIDFLRYANFDAIIDGAKILELQKEIDEKKKLDIPKRKYQLATDRQNLKALKATLQSVIGNFTVQKKQEANKLIAEILEKRKIVESLSIQSFNDGIIKKIGSTEWKSLILAAKIFCESEKSANEGNNLKHCPLCHQELSKTAESLFEKYWQFLESRAESELAQLNQRKIFLLQELKSIKLSYPKFLDTDAGVKILNDENSEYLAQIKAQFLALLEILNIWAEKIEMLQEIDCVDLPLPDLVKIGDLVESKNREEIGLIDPAVAIAKLTAQVNYLKDKKEATSVKDAALEYITFLQWASMAARVNFSGIKMAITKKKTEFFLMGVANNYKGAFNQELAYLGCDFNLIMYTSGEQGNTVKEYHLDFAEDYIPSQILSEGEQNACSIADFLTEIELDKNNCGIIFDDPVTSLDHRRKDKIAQRLVLEANRRQVVIFSHDIVFMGQLVRHAEINRVPLVAHWMRQINGISGCVEDNTSPKLSSLASLKNDFQQSLSGFSTLGAKEQERALGVAFDYLRSACESLIEEVLFNGTIKRYEDYIRVQNLEEAVFDQSLALKIVNFHGRVSEFILAHNRSDLQREDQPTITNFNSFKEEFEKIEIELKESKKLAEKDREVRKKARKAATVGW